MSRSLLCFLRVANTLFLLATALGAYGLYGQQGKTAAAALAAAFGAVTIVNMVVAERLAKLSGEEAALESELRKARIRRQIAEVA